MCFCVVLPKNSLRAYADDTAVILKDIFRDGPRLLHLYREFGDISGLRVNLPKSVVIPLTNRIDIFKEEFQNRCPTWEGIESTRIPNTWD